MNHGKQENRPASGGKHKPGIVPSQMEQDARRERLQHAEEEGDAMRRKAARANDEPQERTAPAGSRRADSDAQQADREARRDARSTGADEGMQDGTGVEREQAGNPARLSDRGPRQHDVDRELPRGD